MMDEVELIQAEIDRDEYELERLVKPGSQWFDAGAHDGLISARIIELGGWVKGFAESDESKYISLCAKYDQTVRANRVFDYTQLLLHHYDGAKIDIQGAEAAMLWISTYNWESMPDILIIEWHEYANNIPACEMYEVLEDNEYFITTKQSFDALDRKPAEIIIAEKLKR